MEKRAFIAVAISILILLVWSMLFEKQPPPEEGVATDRPAETEEALPREATEPEPAPPEPPVAEEIPVPDRQVAESAQDIVIENDLVRVVLTNAGARVRSWQLKAYGGADGAYQELLPCLEGDDNPLPLELDLDSQPLTEELNSTLYVVETDGAAGAGSPSTARFTYSDGRGLVATKTLSLRQGSYVSDLTVVVEDRGRALPARVAWGPGFQAQGSGAGSGVTSYYNYAGQAVWNVGGQVTRVRGHKVDDETFGGRVVWAGLEDQYFAALVIPGRGAKTVRTWGREYVPCPEETDEEAEEARYARISVSVPPDGTALFVGPKKYTMLRKEGHQLGKVVWFATNPLLAAIARSLFLALIWIHDHIVANYGVAIILATMALRIVLFPLNQFSMVRMKKTQLEMQRLQPKLNAIKKRYQKKKDAQSRAKMNQEMMALYRDEGVSPMGGVVGCLPMLAQFPILIGFYNMLTVAIELRGAPFFGWIQDLSQRDPYYVTPLLMGATMFLQQKMSQTKATDPTQRQQQMIMMFMPFFFTYICIQMPSGMVLYWFINNLLGIGQQWLVNRHTTRLESATQKA